MSVSLRLQAALSSRKLYIPTNHLIRAISVFNSTRNFSISKRFQQPLNATELKPQPQLKPMDPNFDYADLFSDTNLVQLQKNLQTSLSTQVNYRFKYDTTQTISEAAVLVLLCLSNGEPSILFTERSTKLKQHPNEISFPGGKRDNTDHTLVDTALRETEEEVGIDRLDIKILGSMSPLPNKDRNIKVYPIIGILNFNLVDKENGFYSVDNAKYGGKTMDLSRLTLNKNEVESAFTLPLRHLLSDKGVVKWDRFRNTDIMFPRYESPENVQSDIWGLTAAILFKFLKVWFPEHNEYKL